MAVATRNNYNTAYNSLLRHVAKVVLFRKRANKMWGVWWEGVVEMSFLSNFLFSFVV